MSAIMNFAIFPLDKGDHVSEYVGRVVAHIRESGYSYEFTPMATIVEADNVSQLLALVEESYKILEPVSDRVYCNMTLDYSKTKTDRINGKRTSVINKIGKV